MRSSPCLSSRLRVPRAFHSSVLGAPSETAAPPDKAARDNHSHDLVCAFQDLVHAKVPHDLLDAIIGKIAVAAVKLKRLVGDLETYLRSEAFGHRAELRRLRVFGVERRCRAP